MAEHEIYFTYGQLDDGRYCGVVSRGSPQRGDGKVEVLTVEALPTEHEIVEWGHRALKEHPWEPRS